MHSAGSAMLNEKREEANVLAICVKLVANGMRVSVKIKRILIAMILGVTYSIFSNVRK